MLCDCISVLAALFYSKERRVLVPAAFSPALRDLYDYAVQMSGMIGFGMDGMVYVTPVARTPLSYPVELTGVHDSALVYLLLGFNAATNGTIRFVDPPQLSRTELKRECRALKGQMRTAFNRRTGTLHSCAFLFQERPAPDSGVSTAFMAGMLLGAPFAPRLAGFPKGDWLDTPEARQVLQSFETYGLKVNETDTAIETPMLRFDDTLFNSKTMRRRRRRPKTPKGEKAQEDTVCS